MRNASASPAHARDSSSSSECLSRALGTSPGSDAVRTAVSTARRDSNARGMDVVVTSGSGMEQQIRVGRHQLVSDEPVAFGGTDTGPSPYELLAAAVGACTSMTLRMYARAKGWPLRRVIVTIRHDKIYARDCAECETKEGRIDTLERRPVAGDGVRSGICRHLAADEVEELRAHPGRGIDRRAQDLDRGRLDAQSSLLHRFRGRPAGEVLARLHDPRYQLGKEQGLGSLRTSELHRNAHAVPEEHFHPSRAATEERHHHRVEPDGPFYVVPGPFCRAGPIGEQEPHPHTAEAKVAAFADASS